MDWLHKFLFSAFLILAAAIDGALADAMVTGTVFCDQCKDGRVSLFDYPLSGIKVAMACADGNGQLTASREETTNWLGSYAVKFDGTPDLSNCYAQVSSSGQGSNACGAAAGPPQKLNLMFRLFDMEFYNVDPLLSQPALPMSFCPKSRNPLPPPVTPVMPPSGPPPAPPKMPTPPVWLPPMPWFPPLPPLPSLPPLPPMPPMPFAEASACTHKNWTSQEYKCYWRAVSPDTKVGVVFGLPAARRYGTDMTLWQGLQGRGDPDRTLLREATTALLNSYTSLQFPYNAVTIITHMNSALVGSSKSAVHMALRFKRANSGSGDATCKFTPCN